MLGKSAGKPATHPCARLWLTLVALVALNLGAAAQADAQVIGFKIGPTFANLDVDDDESDEGTLTSFGGGGFIRFAVGGFSIQPEIMVFTKGSEIDFTSDSDVALKIDYVEVPLFARFGFGSGNFAPYIMAGPTVSFEISCNVDVDVGTDEDSFECDEPGADIFERKSTDFSLTGALGFEYRIGPGSILVEGRYVYGLTDIADSDFNSVRNRMFGFSAGYSISLSGM